MASRIKIIHIIFSMSIVVWIILLLTIWLPISHWMTPTFPAKIDNNLLTFFLLSTGFSSLTSLYKGLDILIQQRKEKATFAPMQPALKKTFSKAQNSDKSVSNNNQDPLEQLLKQAEKYI